MRMAQWSAVTMVAGMMLVSACGPGYRTTRMSASAQLGPGIEIYSYSTSRDGDWHANYRQWSPATVYELNGSYYSDRVTGGREVQVYRTSGGYMLPPRDKDLRRTDRRLNGKRLPNNADYSRAHNHQ